MKRLDLHKVKHIDVPVLVEDFILENQTPLYVVTGNSIKMQKIVFQVLEKHNFKWMIMSHNLGEIIIL